MNTLGNSGFIFNKQKGYQLSYVHHSWYPKEVPYFYQLFLFADDGSAWYVAKEGNINKETIEYLLSIK